MLKFIELINIENTLSCFFIHNICEIKQVDELTTEICSIDGSQTVRAKYNDVMSLIRVVNKQIINHARRKRRSGAI